VTIKNAAASSFETSVTFTIERYWCACKIIRVMLYWVTLKSPVVRLSCNVDEIVLNFGRIIACSYRIFHDICLPFLANFGTVP
jgi:hypothetical protein